MQNQLNRLNSNYQDGVVHLTDFSLQNSLVIDDLMVSYRIHGDPQCPVVVVLGGISAHRGLTASADSLPAWWPQMVGPGLAVDTNSLCVLSFDYLGGNAGTFGPRHANWPREIVVDTMDQAQLAYLLCQNLGLCSIHDWIGASYGGMVGLAYALRYPHHLRHLTLISAAHRAHPMAMAWRLIQRAIVALGRETGEVTRSLALARALAMTTYRSPEEFGARFHDFDEVSAYLTATGSRYAAVTHADAFTCLSQSIDDHCIDAAALNGIELDIIGFYEDRLVPPDVLQCLAELSGGRLHLYHSLFGHDAFLKETRILSEIFTQFQREIKSCTHKNEGQQPLLYAAASTLIRSMVQ